MRQWLFFMIFCLTTVIMYSVGPLWYEPLTVDGQALDDRARREVHVAQVLYRVKQEAALMDSVSPAMRKQIQQWLELDIYQLETRLTKKND